MCFDLIAAIGRSIIVYRYSDVNQKGLPLERTVLLFLIYCAGISGAGVSAAVSATGTCSTLASISAVASLTSVGVSTAAAVSPPPEEGLGEVAATSFFGMLKAFTFLPSTKPLVTIKL